MADYISAENLVLEKMKIKTERNFILVYGSVKNVGEQPISGCSLLVEYLDSDGNVVDSEYVVQTGLLINPRAGKRFYIQSQFFKKMKDAKVTISNVTPFSGGEQK